jgi:hypothetical protein
MFENSLPCIVELFGHQRIAGRVSEQQLGGTNFIRVDVPEVDEQPGFTKLYGASAIYAITPTDEATMIQAVRAFRVVPIEAYRLKTTVLAQLNAGDGYDDDSEDVGF